MKKHKLIYSTLVIALADRYLTSKLKELAAIICPKVPSKKAERVEAIVNTMFKDLKGVFEQLPPLGQHAVSETVHTWDGVYEHRMFINKYNAAPQSEPRDDDPRNPELIYLFLIDKHIPRDLLAELKTFVPKPIDHKIRYLDEDPYDAFTEEFLTKEEGLTVRMTAHAALVNLTTLLSFADDKKIRVSAKTGKATAATVKKINALLYEGDWYEDNDENEEIGSMQPFAWPLLLQGGGLAKADGSCLKLTPAGRKALKKDPAGGIKTAWTRWEKSKLFDEFSRVTAIKGQRSSRGRTMTTPVKRRPMLNNLLEDLEPGKWINVETVFRVLQSSSLYSFEMVNYSWKLYVADQNYGLIDYDDPWIFLQFRYLLVYLFEYCATLGLVDLAYKNPAGARDDFRSCWGTDDLLFLSHCDGLEYVRINELGAFVFGHTDSFTPQKEQKSLYAFEEKDILVSNNGTLAPGEELFLEKIAERKEVDRWRMSAPLLLTAVSNGNTLADIKTTLEEGSSEEFSRDLVQLFEDVAQRSTAFVDIGQTTLLACNPEFRKQVLTHKKLSNLCLPAGNKHLVILPGKEKIFAKALEAIGFIIGRK